MACKCGSTEVRTVEIAHDGVVVAEGDVCEACFAAALDGAAELRLEFEGLLTQGIDRRMANRIMCVRVDRMMSHEGEGRS